MPLKDLNRQRKTYSFIRRKPSPSLQIEDKNAESNKIFEFFEDFSFASGDVSDASGSGFISHTTSKVLDERLQSMPYISIEHMDFIDSTTFAYIRESTRAVGTDKLVIDIFFKSSLSNPSNTFKISQSDLQTKLGSDTINVKLKLSYIV